MTKVLVKHQRSANMTMYAGVALTVVAISSRTSTTQPPMCWPTTSEPAIPRTTTLRGLRGQGVQETPDVVLADASYWHTAQMQQIAERGIEVLAPPDGNMREGTRPGAPTTTIQLSQQVDP